MDKIGDLVDMEIHLLNGNRCKDLDDSRAFIQAVDRGSYDDILKEVLSNKITPFGTRRPDGISVGNFLCCAVKEYLADGDPCKQLEVLVSGIASLQLFVQSNWTGPALKESPYNVLPWLKSDDASSENVDEEVVKELLLDGESLYPVTKNVAYLLVAKIILNDSIQHLQDLKTSSWWCMRYLYVHQQILEEWSPTIHASLERVIEDISKVEPFMADESYREIQELFNIEAACIYLYYHEVLKSQRFIEAAQKLMDVNITLTGAMGKRTKFQEREYAQLTLKIDAPSHESTDLVSGTTTQDIESTNSLPKDLSLDDDVRLNKVQFSSEDVSLPRLSPLQQVLLLAIYSQTSRSQPKDKLTDEEVKPYLNVVLEQPQMWSVQCSALVFRSRLEAHHSRTVERAMMQTQTLVDGVWSETPEVQERLRLFYGAQMPTTWHLEGSLANLLYSLGAVKSALNIYLRLQLWEDAITCYHRLDLRHKAEEIVRQELLKKETPKMWCLLGDATDDVSCYEKAWELSNYKSARAQRQWGMNYYYKQKYEECIRHFELSLSINSLQLPVWSRLAFAALQVEKWELAASSYRRFCTLEPQNFEAWNNLSRAYVKLGQKRRAWSALQEAVKCNFENWRVWDNITVVSVDCGEFEEVIRSYHRILDLKGKHVDLEVLRVLVKAVLEDTLDCHGNPASRLRGKVLVLLGHLTSQVTNDAILWRLYGQLSASVEEPSEIDFQKAVQHLQKAHRSAAQSSGWEKDFISCTDVLEICTELADVAQNCFQKFPESNMNAQMLSSVKLSLKGVLSKVKQVHTNQATGEFPEELAGSVQAVEQRLETIVQHLQSR